MPVQAYNQCEHSLPRDLNLPLNDQGSPSIGGASHWPVEEMPADAAASREVLPRVGYGGAVYMGPSVVTTASQQVVYHSLVFSSHSH